jgi:23S rRNA U2552 (ribose-2'-O)-methylase RlmE/FtsJ
MVKKLILLVSSETDSIKNTISELLEKNNKLHGILTKHKNQITNYYNDKTWDKYKKISNEYELIFTTPGNNISKYLPVSRSFFKLWEILNDFKDEIFIKENMRCMFLAEGPGGFAESFIKYRYQYSDKLYGITLKSNNNKNIPDWKIDTVDISYGEDGTGNLYNFNNIMHLVKKIGINNLDFITADGGFDFSVDFNNQEDLSTQLILAEILSAVCLQKQGGKFVLKIFDMFNEHTLKIIHLLQIFYKDIYIIKPLTSRPPNSERYLLCINFIKNEKYTNLLIHVIKDYSKENIKNLMDQLDYKPYLLNNLVLYNTYYSLRQIYYIEKTISYINKYKNHYYNDEIKSILHKNKKKSISWCKKYNIDYNE